MGEALVVMPRYGFDYFDDLAQLMLLLYPENPYVAMQRELETRRGPSIWEMPWVTG